MIFHEQLPNPVALGLSPDARLEMFTEQLDGPVPALRQKFIHRETDAVKLATRAEPHFRDADVNFGTMRIVAGKAFGTAKRPNEASILPKPVGKSFETISGRKILIEAVEHRQAAPFLNRLPVSGSRITNASLQFLFTTNIAGLGRSLPFIAKQSAPAAHPLNRFAAIRRVSEQVSGAENLLAAARPPEESPAFVLDYQMVNNAGETDFTFSGTTNYLISGSLPLFGTVTIEGGTVLKFTDDAGLFLAPGAVLVCDTTNYLPAVFTCKNDNTIGETIAGSTGVPQRVLSVGLGFDGGTYEVSHVRFKHLFAPIFGDNSANITVRNVQFVNADSGIYSIGTAAINVFNALAHDCDILYYGDTTAFRGEHITMHHGQALGIAYYPNSSTALLKNCLIVDVPGPLTYSGTVTSEQMVKLASDAGIFQTLEGGAHYLPLTSPFRGIATANIDAKLNSSLAEMTTYAPTLLIGTLSTDTTLLPLLPRDVRTLGYHYPAVDYLVRNLTVQNSTMTLRGGVVVAAIPESYPADWAALRLSPGKFISIGSPTRMNRLLRANQVQENVTARGSAILTDGYQGQFKPEITLRFTDVSSLAGELYLLAAVADYTRFEMSHSTFFNGHISAKHYGGIYQNTGFTNNLFRNVYVQIECTSPAYFYACNNTFQKGAFDIRGTGNANWRIKYNIFDHATVYADPSPFVADENAYVGLMHALGEDGYVEVATLAYASGPLGRFYLGNNSLRNIGSATAGILGLYHFTTSADQAKEGNSPVDYGFHYAASVAATSVNPVRALDTDGDGLADYVEDGNGNGNVDAGETDIANRYSNGSDRDDVIADPEPPVIWITEGVPGVVTRPLIQLQGFSEKPLKTITYSLFTNGVLAKTGDGHVKRQHYDRVTGRFTTNWFQIYDLQLVPGNNQLIAQFTDYGTAGPAGSHTTTRSINYTLDYAGVTQPPVLLSKWPKPGNAISGTQFTLRGYVDDPTSVIFASITAPNGTVSYRQADMERDGLFWADDLPLAPGNNLVTLYMTNAAGISQIESYTVTKSPVTLTIGQVGNVTGTHTTVSGTIDTAGYTVWVNGVKATLNGNSWTAANVPINEGGTATIEAVAIPNTDNGGNGTAPSGGGSASNGDSGNPSSDAAAYARQELEKPSFIRVASTDINTTIDSLWDVCAQMTTGRNNKETTHWATDEGGKWEFQTIQHECFFPDITENKEIEWLPPNDTPRYRQKVNDGSWSPWSNTGYLEGSPSSLREHCDITYLKEFGAGLMERFMRKADTCIELVTGGRGRAGKQNVFVISANANSANNDESLIWPAIPPESLTVAGKHPGADTKLYMLLQDNSTVDITPYAAGKKHYHFGVSQSKHKVRLKANEKDCQDPWLFNRPTFIVGQYVTFSAPLEPPLPIQSQTHQWSLSGDYKNDKYNSVVGGTFPESSDFYFANPDRLKVAKPAGNWWVSGGTGYPHYPVSLKWEITFDNGQQLTVNERGTIRMFRPQPQVATTTGIVAADSNFNDAQLALHYGTPTGTGAPGIKFVNNTAIPFFPNNGFAGTFQWVQVINSYLFRYHEGTGWKRAQGGGGLDAGHPYPGGTAASTDDSPGIPLTTADRMIASGDFSTWLEFVPSGGHPVPLRRINWNWSGDALRSGTTWSLTSASNPVTGNVDTQEYPSWTHIIEGSDVVFTDEP